MIEDNIEVNVSNTIEVVDVFPQITEEVVDINITDNSEDVVINVTESIIEVNINKVTNLLSAVWGSITGTLSDQTDLQNALDDKVPYTGATENVDLGEFGAKVGHLGFDITPTSIPTGIGTTYWDAFYRTLSLVDGDGDTTLQIGQEERVLVHNNTGVSLTDGQVVYVTGSTGELPSVALASNTTETTSSVTFGVVTETILNGNDGFITTSGIIHGLNTLAYTEGSAIWLGSTAGTFTDVKPIAPLNSVLVGYVIKKAGGNGSIFVKIQNGVELDELHNVLISSVANNQGIFWDSATSLWKNKTIATVLGYTPISGSGTTNYLPKFTGSTSIANSLIYDNGTNIGIGTTSPAYKLDVVGTLGVSGAATFSSLVTSQTNLGFINTNASQAGFEANYTGTNAVKVSISTYNDTFQVYNETNGYSIFNFKPSTKAFVINPSGGSVGIGTTSPAVKLDVVYADSAYNAGIKVTNTSNTSASQAKVYAVNNVGDYISLGRNSSALGGQSSIFSTGVFPLQFFTDSLERMRIDATGNLGIGTTSPAQKLHVVGGIRGEYYSSVNNKGLNQIVDFIDLDNVRYQMTFEDGILVGYVVT